MNIVRKITRSSGELKSALKEFTITDALTVRIWDEPLNVVALLSFIGETVTTTFF